jgi:uncharacterized membrane protein/uncharacterized lipoprotein YbaY
MHSLTQALWTVAALTALTGCPRKIDPPPHADPAAPMESAPQEKTMNEQSGPTRENEDRVIRGEGYFLQRIAIPPGSRFIATLVPLSIVGAPMGEPLTKDEKEVSAGPPFPFELSVPSSTAAGTALGVELELNDPEGERWFEQLVAVPDAETSLGRVKLRMRRGQPLTPTERAESRGSTLWGVGQEPGWSIELGAGERPPMHAALDYGQRHLEVEQLEKKADDHFEGVAKSGEAVTVRILPDPCADIMSGERFQLGVELTVGEETFRGCANRVNRD